MIQRENSNSLIIKARILSELLPFMRQFSGETFVIKYAEKVMDDKILSAKFAHDIVMLKQIGIHPIIVHGPGKEVSRIFEQLNLLCPFAGEECRALDQDTIDIIEMVLSGCVNKRIVSSINEAGGSAVGLSGKDGNLIEARKKRRIKNPSHSNIETISDLGFIGEPTMINPDVLIAFEESDLIPIIAPIGIGENGETYYLNPDQVAAALASSLAACKLLILTDSHGLLTESSDLIENITVNRARQLISEGAVSKEMLSKVEACISALENHTGSAHILDGRIEHALLLEIFTSQRVGTMFSRE